MPDRNQKPKYSNDAEIIFVDPKEGVGGKVRRPLTDEQLERIREYFANTTDIDRLTDAYFRRNGLTGKASMPVDEVTIIE